METIHKIGRRKTSVARIYLKKGKGNFTINNKEWKNYFPTSAHQFKISQPFNICEVEKKFDMEEEWGQFCDISLPISIEAYPKGATH